MIFFDIDGTLVDHKEAERVAALAFQRAHGEVFPESPEDFAARWHLVAEKHLRRHLVGEISFQAQRRARLRELFSHHSALTDEDADAVFGEYLKRYEASWRLFADVRPCLAELDGRRLGIISNGDSKQQRQKIEMLGIAGRFSTVVISGDVGSSKPAVEIFLTACRAAQMDPDQCYYVGDDVESDVYGSRNAGLQAIWLNRDAGVGSPDIPTISTLAELKRKIA